MSREHRLAEALTGILDDLEERVIDDVVAIGNGVYFEANQALAEYEASKTALPGDRQKASEDLDLALNQKIEIRSENHYGEYEDVIMELGDFLEEKTIETIHQALQQPAPEVVSVEKFTGFFYGYLNDPKYAGRGWELPMKDLAKKYPNGFKIVDSE